ncbi:Uncharacterized protein dnm_047340 [Desulfonema magnum]|uniref:Uncharacterized protein n=1 Tax=Desulfonema magnum TaxID=45655 RepID=A0A975BNA4_9BACT|nr:Uncharacterized protein dnm_047340 [Desulfonema magnum]
MPIRGEKTFDRSPGGQDKSFSVFFPDRLNFIINVEGEDPRGLQNLIRVLNQQIEKL